MQSNILNSDILPLYFSFLFPLKISHLIVSTLVASLLLSVLWLYIKYLQVRKILNEEYTFLEIKPVTNATPSAFSTQQFFTVLHSLQKPFTHFEGFLNTKKALSYEIVSTKEDGIRYILRVPTSDVSTIKKTLPAYVLGVEIREVGDYLTTDMRDMSIYEIKLTKPYAYPLQDQTLLKEYDPI